MFSKTPLAQSLSRLIARTPASDGYHQVLMGLYTAAMFTDLRGALGEILTYCAPVPFYPLPGHLGTQIALCHRCADSIPPFAGKHSKQLTEFFGYHLRVDWINWEPETPSYLWESGEFVPCDRCGKDTGGEYAAEVYGGEGWALYGRPEAVRAALGHPDYV